MPAKFRRVPKSLAHSYGMVLDLPGARFVRCSEEHGWIDINAWFEAPAVGDRLRVIPNHVCLAVNLHERVYGARGARVEAVWTVTARGKVQ